MKILKDYNEYDDSLFYKWYDTLNDVLYLYEDSSGMFGVVSGNTYDKDYPFEDSVDCIEDRFNIIEKVFKDYKENMDKFVREVNKKIG